MYDVAVVGAGPTGAALSYFLSSSGLRVLVIEKDPRPGTRTICGEYLPDPGSLGLEGEIASAYMSFFKPFIVHTMERITMEIGDREFTTNYTGYSVDRREMVISRLEESVVEGSTLRTKEAFITARLSGDAYEVRTSKDRYVARYLVGADGFDSRVAKLINGSTAIKCDDLALAFSSEVRIEVEEPDVMKLVINESLAPGTYAWVIPRSEGVANVGIGVRLSMMNGFDPRRAFKEHLIRLGAAAIEPKLRGRYVPAGGMVGKLHEAGIFLAGDAAGMTIPSNGGGMHTGIIAAYLLAKSLADGSPRSYISSVNRIIRPMVDTGLTHRRAADFLLKTGLLWKTVKFLPRSLIEEVIRMERGPYYPLLKLLSSLYGLVRGKVGNYPACKWGSRTHHTLERSRTHWSMPASPRSM